MTPHTLLVYARAVPFRPFRIHVASGRIFEVRHPEMIKVLRTGVLIFKDAGGDHPDLPDEWEILSLMLIESVTHLETTVS